LPIARRSSSPTGGWGSSPPPTPADLIAAIGACLGVCCGEVGPDVVEAFGSAGHARADIARWFNPGRGDRFYLDLAAANADQLVAAGVPREHTHVSGLCTKSYSQLFHSYRAHGRDAGRMAGVIRRKKEEGRTVSKKD
jgi:copper oxidase (laccase) domain-containing protein